MPQILPLFAWTAGYDSGSDHGKMPVVMTTVSCPFPLVLSCDDHGDSAKFGAAEMHRQLEGIFKSTTERVGTFKVCFWMMKLRLLMMLNF